MSGLKVPTQGNYFCQRQQAYHVRRFLTIILMGRLQKPWKFEQAICRAVEVGIAYEVLKLRIRYGDLRVRHQPWIKKSNSLANGKKITSVESTGDAFPPKHLQDSTVTMHFSCQVIEMVNCTFTDMQQNQQPLNFSMSQNDG